MAFDPAIGLVLFAVATLAGFVDAIAGGGGLLTIPALLWAGISPVQALATNKLQACFGSGSASWHFIRERQVTPGDFPLALLCCAAGAAMGALSVNRLDPGWLQNIIPLMLVGAALFFLFSPSLPRHAVQPRLSAGTYAVCAAFGIGFYDGFFGPGTGSFLVLSLVTLQGLELSQATARTKVLNFASNLASFAVFSFGGQILWGLGLIMAVGQAIGARLGARMVVRKGALVIRPFLVAVSLALTVHLVLSAPHSLWRGLLLGPAPVQP